MYDYQRGSTTATRTLISDQKPSEIHSSASHDHHSSANDTQKPPLQRNTTNHYEQAVAAAGQTAAGSEIEERPALDRQQSWKMSDLKREHAEKMLSAEPRGQGYSSK
ncbi:hypothetical protein TI39_contig453g00013 [Zymoseptoria brevis]|uniref:Uncharacterized protein n=1 Tax=Zymoseptoria brevis TaxID=1047168 RepID=A0A0F4GKH7_9PEZI|nr:hypothetical protein TI39_contig453g00013 [Zymoseptoria brevis]